MTYDTFSSRVKWRRADSVTCIRLIDNTVDTDFLKHRQLECGPMPSVMAALPNIGGALCSTPQSLADAHYYSAVQ